MNKYEVTFEQVEHFVVTVDAKDEQEADDLASEMFSSGDYDEVGDCSITNVVTRKL